jgi:hypothetical protein
MHEFGSDQIEGDKIVSIPSSFTTSNMSLIPSNLWTRLIRVEPDFVQHGAMEVEVITQEFPNSDHKHFGPYPFTNTTEKIDMRIQGRIIYLKFKSDDLYGDYHLGKPMIHIEAGDLRS